MRTVLIVDDDELSRLDVMSKLAELGLESIELDSGKLVMSTIVNNFPSALIVDLVMDEQDGFETINQIKKNSIPIPLFAMSSNETYLSAHKTFKKPVDFAALRDSLVEACVL